MSQTPAADLHCELDPQVALILIDLQKFIRKLPYTHPINEVAARAGSLAAAFRASELGFNVTVASDAVTDMDAEVMETK